MRSDLHSPHRGTGLVDVLDRVLDKGLVIAGDIKITEAMIEAAWAYLCDEVPEWNRSLGNSRPVIVGMFEAAGFKVGDDDQSKTAEEPRD